MDELQVRHETDDFALRTTMGMLSSRLPRAKVRGLQGQIKFASSFKIKGQGGDAAVFQIGLTGGMDTQWLSMQEMTQWRIWGDNDSLIERAYGLDRLPKTPQNILVRSFDGTLGVFNSTLRLEGSTGVLWNLSDGQRYRLPDLDATNWQVVGLKREMTLDRALRRWSGRSLRHHKPAWGSAAVMALGMAGGISTGSVLSFAVVTGLSAICAASVACIIPTQNGSIVRKQVRVLQRSYDAPEPTKTPAIESSLAKRFSDVTDRRSIEYSITALTHLASLSPAGQHVLKNLDALDVRAQEEATILLLDNLPKALDLHASILQKSVSEQAHADADARLIEHLSLIEAEVESLVEAIDTALAREQEEFSHYLDAKLRRSELDS